MEAIIISGMSGAGKSTVLGVLEDMDYFCMDNVPPDLFIAAINIMKHPSINKKRFASVIDVRTGEVFESIDKVIRQLRKMGVNVRVIFLDAKDDILLNRYNLTRRKHPLSDGKTPLRVLIQKERELLSGIKEQADYVIDTSLMNSHELRRRIVEIVKGEKAKTLTLFIESFGFKHGLPMNADFVFDARFLPNPYYIKELENKTGEDPEVQKFFEQFEIVNSYISKLYDILNFVIDYYSKEAKDILYVSVGCTGGKHRSVYIAKKLAELFKDKVDINLSHRDIERGKI